MFSCVFLLFAVSLISGVMFDFNTLCVLSVCVVICCAVCAHNVVTHRLQSENTQTLPQ